MYTPIRISPYVQLNYTCVCLNMYLLDCGCTVLYSVDTPPCVYFTMCILHWCVYSILCTLHLAKLYYMCLYTCLFRVDIPSV